MNINYSTTDNQDSAIAALRKQYKRTTGNDINDRQYAELRVNLFMENLITEAQSIVGRDELIYAYRDAPNAVKESVRQLLNI